MIALLALVCALQEPVVLRTAESDGKVTVTIDDQVARGKVAVVDDPKARPAGAETVVWVASMPREQAAAALRETPGIVAVVSGRGGGDVEPLKIGDSWMVQAPGSTGLSGRLEIRGGLVTYRLEEPKDRKPSAIEALRASASKDAAPAPAAALETGNRACKLRIFGMTERPVYGAKAPAAGKKLLVLDAEFENIIPLTLVQSNQVPTIYKIKDLADHLYLVVNGVKVSRLSSDAASLPGHMTTVGFALDRLGTRMRGNLVYEIPEGATRLDLRFYDYSHGHMALLLRAGEIPEARPLLPLKENEVLEAGVFRVDRPAGQAAPEGMAWLAVELRARSRMVTESDATAFDPKAKPGDKVKIGTVSDWTDLKRHLNVLVDGARSIASSDVADLGEAPRFIPDVLTGGVALFLVPAKTESLELRCDFPNAKLPNGQIVHPPALVFLLEGKRPEAAAKPALAEIDDDIYKVAVTGQRVAAEVGGQKAPAGTKFLVVEVSVKGNGKAGELFQTAEQLSYATEK
ncbi:MAG: hypothetical protein JO332_04345, partial [Planctomycetaceae bacterium]|nr:hypothetical protein [Planctomycetaceae bacterium]